MVCLLQMSNVNAACSVNPIPICSALDDHSCDMVVQTFPASAPDWILLDYVKLDTVLGMS